MLSAQLIGFSQEKNIRLAATLAGGGVYSEPATQVPSTPVVDAVFLDGNSRRDVAQAMGSWAGHAPPYNVAFMYPIDDLPLNGSSLFPSWVDLITKSGLDEYLQGTFSLDQQEAQRPAPRTVGYSSDDGEGIAQVEVLGPSGLIFDTGRKVRRSDAVTFYIPLGRRTPLAMRGKVVSRRPWFRGRSRCVASFMDAPGPQRRALGCLLAGWC